MYLKSEHTSQIITTRLTINARWIHTRILGDMLGDAHSRYQRTWRPRNEIWLNMKYREGGWVRTNPFSSHKVVLNALRNIHSTTKNYKGWVFPVKLQPKLSLNHEFHMNQNTNHHIFEPKLSAYSLKIIFWDISVEQIGKFTYCTESVHSAFLCRIKE